VSVGLAQGCVDECLRYIREREAFGHTIGTYQSIRSRCGHGGPGTTPPAWPTTTRTSKLLARRAVQEGRRDRQAGRLERGDGQRSGRYAIFGGYGFMNEFPVGRFYRDAKILEIGEGTSRMQRMLIAARSAPPADP